MKNLNIYFKTILMLCCLSSLLFAQETRTKIAIVDTGIDLSRNLALMAFLCHQEQADFTSSTLLDTSGHGTTMAGLITQGLDSSKYCISILKVWDRGGNACRIVKALNTAMSYNVSYVNISMSGDEYSFSERQVIEAPVAKGVVVTMAAGNEGQNLDRKCQVFPACYSIKGAYVVGALEHGTTAGYSNYGQTVNAWAPGSNQCVNGWCVSGTSAATANFLNYLIKHETR